MAVHRFGNRSIPPMVDHHYQAKEDLPKKPSSHGALWTILVMAALFVIGGILYFATGSHPGWSSSTTGAAPQAEPRPIPQVPPVSAPPVRAQE